tara:strand:+ start:209 stop:454 length:246 start_codon:yes stop_codon:yes gene_type:complete
MSKVTHKKPTIKQLSNAVSGIINDMYGMHRDMQSLLLTFGKYVKFNSHEHKFKEFLESEFKKDKKVLEKKQKENEPKTENK